MSYENLLKQGRIKPHKVRREEVLSLFDLASRDLRAAERTLSVDTDWAYTMAYNAILQSARAFMLSHGFRPRGAEQHLTVVQFARETLGEAYRDQITLFDQMRRKRHRTIYETSGLIGEAEAEQALALAKLFVSQLKKLTLENSSTEQ
jgi:uncharacterized protein (UPF0332 family)